MAYVLSLRPHSPLKRSFSDNPYLQPCSPLKDPTIAALRDLSPRNTSACSLYSLGPNSAAEWLCATENSPPPLTSSSLLELVTEREACDSHEGPSHPLPPKKSRGFNRPSPCVFRTCTAPSDLRPKKIRDVKAAVKYVDHGPFPTEPMAIDSNIDDEIDYLELYEAIHIPIPEGRWSDNTSSGLNEASEQSLGGADASSQPFRRWMSTLRRRHVHRCKVYQREVPRHSAGAMGGSISFECLHAAPLPTSEVARRFSGFMSSSSLGCVTAVKSASITVASVSIAPRSDNCAPHTKNRIGNRSSHLSEARKSTESHRALGPVLDESAWLRSIQRRKIVEELISSEESYIADLKVLINDYFMILTGIPALPVQTRASIQRNISQILQLHQDLLADLHQAVPQADYAQGAHQEVVPVTRAKHIRFHSADLVPGRFVENKVTKRLRHSLDIGRSPERRGRGSITDTKTVGEIAKIFNKHMKRFFAYEEYGAHWTTMSQDLTITCRGLDGWQEYERGVEALSKVVASENNRTTSSRKALSFPDLLIKPIQRVCKYPLLFEDLCRHTPVFDDPEAHAELEKALFRLQETIREVNKAKDDPKTRRLIEITWQLQDRLSFHEQTHSRALVFRLLGHVLVCGVLHVAYQAQERPKGQYMICVLYKSCLVLATVGRFLAPYNVVASISLANGSIDEADNGRGLICHTAPYTWKLVFEHNHRLHEIILSACSVQEEETWKQQLGERIVCETHDFVEGQSTMQDNFTSLSLDIKSIGPVFGHNDSLVRRMSVHRAATMGSKQHTTQVIIKNTQAQKIPEPPPPFAPNAVTRSQSHLSVNHIPTLAPRRAERIRLETALEEVWTKDILPFPGMSNRRMENQIRASANSVMRKLSMASIASNFSRRSPSFSSVSNARSDDLFSSRVHKMSQGNLRAPATTDRHPAAAVVDFHTAPAAFLPTDFDLQDSRAASRRRRLANRTAGAERTSDKHTPRPKRTRRLSTHMISLPRMDPSTCVEARSFSGASYSTLLHSNEVMKRHDRPQGREKQKKDEQMERSSRKDRLSDTPPPSKKSLKSKSRIFKFWA